MPDRRHYTKEEVQEKVSFAEMKKDVSVIRIQVEKLSASFEAAEARYVTKEEFQDVPRDIEDLKQFKTKWLTITILGQLVVVPLVIAGLIKLLHL